MKIESPQAMVPVGLAESTKADNLGRLLTTTEKIGSVMAKMNIKENIVRNQELLSGKSCLIYRNSVWVASDFLRLNFFHN